MVKLSDTSPEAERVLIEAYRRITAAQKWRLLGQLYHEGRLLHAAGERFRNPAATDADINAAWLRDQLGVTVPAAARAAPSERTMQDLGDLRAVLRVLTALNIAHAVGGSMASSFHGVSRLPRAADVAVEPFPGKEAQFAAAFGPEYYLSEDAIRQAVLAGSSFNIINTSTGFKIDLFVRKDTPFESSALSRSVALAFPDLPGEPVRLLTPEDIILYKLRWYRLGNETSDQQWADVLGVFRVQGARLDQTYLDRWAADQGVADLLARARQESVIP